MVYARPGVIVFSFDLLKNLSLGVADTYEPWRSWCLAVSSVCGVWEIFTPIYIPVYCLSDSIS